MWAARPTARPAFAVLEVLAAPDDALRSRLGLFGGVDPADPFIAGERRNIPPGRQRLRIGAERRFQVQRQSVHDAA